LQHIRGSGSPKLTEITVSIHSTNRQHGSFTVHVNWCQTLGTDINRTIP